MWGRSSAAVVGVIREMGSVSVGGIGGPFGGVFSRIGVGHGLAGELSTGGLGQLMGVVDG